MGPLADKSVSSADKLLMLADKEARTADKQTNLADKSVLVRRFRLLTMCLNQSIE